MVTAIILAGGKGTRLRPLTYGIPKPLLPVKGTPMIDWVIRSILSNEIKEIVVGVSGTTGEDIEDRMLSHVHGICIDSYLKKAGHVFRIKTIPTPQRETAGDLKFVLEEASIRKGRILVVYGDNLTSFDVDKLLQYHESAKQKHNVAGTVVLFEAPEADVHRFGIAKIKQKDGIDLIENFIEKPTLQQAPSRLASAGYYVLDVEDVFDIFPREKIKVEQSLFPLLASQGRLAGFITKLPYWIDISTLEAYELANRAAYDNLIMPPSLPEDRNEKQNNKSS